MAFGRDEDGQIVVLGAIVLVALLFAVALVVNTGQLFVVRRTAQSAADAAALAGATSLSLGGTTGNAVAAGQSAATRGGFTTGSGVTVTINVPPSSGSSAGIAGYVEAIIAQPVSSLLVPQWAMTTVTARAVAYKGGGFRFSTLALGTGTALSSAGSGTFTATGGDIWVNSTAAVSASTGGTSHLTASGSNIVLCGGYSGTGFAPTPTTPCPQQQADPFSTLPRPDCPVGNSTCSIQMSCCSGTVTIDPGVYSSISASPATKITMNPGTYIIRGGGISLAAGATLSGSGVTVFNTGNGYSGPSGGTGSCSSVTFSANSVWALSAPTSGTYQGLTLFQDAGCTTGISLNGGASGTILTGTVYAPGATLSLSGGTSLMLNSLLVARSISAGGSGDITVNYVPSQNAGFAKVTLTE